MRQSEWHPRESVAAPSPSPWLLVVFSTSDNCNYIFSASNRVYSFQSEEFTQDSWHRTYPNRGNCLPAAECVKFSANTVPSCAHMAANRIRLDGIGWESPDPMSYPFLARAPTWSSGGNNPFVRYLLAIPSIPPFHSSSRDIPSRHECLLSASVWLFMFL